MKFAKELNQEMRDIYFSYYSVMNGITSAPEMWQTCTAAASGFSYYFSRKKISKPVSVTLNKIVEEYLIFFRCFCLIHPALIVAYAER
jgi:hypothetical protein